MFQAQSVPAKCLTTCFQLINWLFNYDRVSNVRVCFMNKNAIISDSFVNIALCATYKICNYRNERAKVQILIFSPDFGIQRKKMAFKIMM